MNKQSKNSWVYLIVIIVMALITLAASYTFNQKQLSSVEEPIVLTQGKTVIPTIVPLEAMIGDEDSNYGQRELATDFDPIRFELSQVNIDVQVRSVGVNSNGHVVTPSHSAGYWISSAKLNEPGNIVIVGHNRAAPMSIFRNLGSATLGNEVILTDSKAREYAFIISEIHIIGVENAPEVETKRIIDMMGEQPDKEQILTIVSCHPTPYCSDRIILIAEPINPKAN